MAERPNVVWILPDEQRRDSVSAYGAPWARTPHLDALAARGTRFERAYTTSPVCVSARASMITGRTGSSLGVLNNHHVFDPSRAPFLTDTFAAAGYRTASFGKTGFNSPVPAFGTQAGCVLGERVHYFGYLVPVDEAEAGVVQYPGDEASRWLLAGRYPGGVDDTPEMENVRQALAWLDDRDPSAPFLLRLSLNAPHTPVVTPAPFDTMVPADTVDLPIDQPDDLPGYPDVARDYLLSRSDIGRLTPEQIARIRQCYYGHVAFVDHVVGRFLDGLRERGVLDDALVAVVSDHGTHLGDHGFVQKQSFWEESVTVPFIMAGPGVAEGRVVDGPVSTGSLLPTLLDLAGLEPDTPVHYGSAFEAGPVFSEIDYGLRGYRPGDRYVMVRDGSWKMALYRDRADHDRFGLDDGLMLYDLEADPGERLNLAGDPDHAGTVRRLAGLIDAWDDGQRDVAP